MYSSKAKATSEETLLYWSERSRRNGGRSVSHAGQVCLMPLGFNTEQLCVHTLRPPFTRLAATSAMFGALFGGWFLHSARVRTRSTGNTQVAVWFWTARACSNTGRIFSIFLFCEVLFFSLAGDSLQPRFHSLCSLAIMFGSRYPPLY